MKALRWLAATAAGAIAVAALAQDRPESILPPGFDEPPAATPTPTPTPATPSPGATPAPGPAAPTTPGTAPDASIAGSDAAAGLEEEDALDALEVPSAPELPASARRDPRDAGGIAADAVGLDAAAWGSASGRTLEILMRRMDTPLASRWAHIGLRNLLVAKIPPAYGVNAADWAAERAWLLLRMGEADAARMVVASIDVQDFTPKLRQVAFQTALATSDPSALCAIDKGLGALEPQAAPMVDAMCDALAGDQETAAANLEKIRRRGSVGGADLQLANKLVGAAADGDRAIDVDWGPVTSLTSWRYGLSTAVGLMAPAKLYDEGPARVMAWRARAPMLSVPDRLPAARVAAGLGVFSSAALGDLYALSYDQADPDELGSSDAWQLRLAYVGKDEETRLAAIRKLAGEDSGDGASTAFASLNRYGGIVAVARAASLIAPTSAAADDAPLLIEAMLAAGYDREAARWAAIVDGLDDGPRDRAWAMLALGAPDGSGIDVSRGRIEQFLDNDDSPGRQRGALLVAGLAGLGRINSEDLVALNREYQLGLVMTTLWSRLADGAGRRGQAGTMRLLAATGLQASSAEAVHAPYVMHSVAGLRATGQGFLARMIAAEMLARA